MVYGYGWYFQVTGREMDMYRETGKVKMRMM